MRSCIPGGESTSRRYHLCTGELAIHEGNRFVVVSTGEKLKQIGNEAENRRTAMVRELKSS